jgi:restriction system protein
VKTYDGHCSKAYLEGLAWLNVSQCSDCGWWQVEHTNVDEIDENKSRNWLSQAVMKEADVSSMAIPLSDLAAYLKKNGEKIYGIHDRKMEELVCAVMSDHFNCEVVHCGRTGDRGIDLLLILRDEAIPVQVKRRMAPGRTETVSVIRSLLGVMFRDQRRSAMVVTTADHFSPHAKREVAEVINKGLVDRFDLVDVHSFIDILKSHTRSLTSSFLDVIPEILGGKLRGWYPKHHNIAT